MSEVDTQTEYFEIRRILEQKIAQKDNGDGTFTYTWSFVYEPDEIEISAERLEVLN